MPPSKVGTIDPLDTKTRVYVDEELNEVGAGSSDAAFVYARSDLERLRTRREELGIGGDEAARVSRESTKRALAAAERRAKDAAAEAELLRERVKADEKAVKAEGKSSSATEDAGGVTVTKAEK